MYFDPIIPTNCFEKRLIQIFHQILQQKIYKCESTFFNIGFIGRIAFPSIWLMSMVL